MVECADVLEHRRNMTAQQQRDYAGWLHTVGVLSEDTGDSVVAINATDLNLDLDTLETMNGTTDLV